jgi:hypothetical protein
MCSTSLMVPVVRVAGMEAALAMEVDRIEAAAAPPDSWMKRRRLVLTAMEGAGLSSGLAAGIERTPVCWLRYRAGRPRREGTAKTFRNLREQPAWTCMDK